MKILPNVPRWYCKQCNKVITNMIHAWLGNTFCSEECLDKFKEGVSEKSEMGKRVF